MYLSEFNLFFIFVCLSLRLFESLFWNEINASKKAYECRWVTAKTFVCFYLIFPELFSYYASVVLFFFFLPQRNMTILLNIVSGLSDVEMCCLSFHQWKGCKRPYWFIQMGHCMLKFVTEQDCALLDLLMSI